jgi:predicted aspartyl protease
LWVFCFRVWSKNYLLDALVINLHDLSMTTEAPSMLIETIPLILRSTGSGTFVPDVEVLVDGHPKVFLLDTGAVTSSIANDPHVDSYASFGGQESKGAAGIGKPGDRIQPDKILLGGHLFRKAQITRCSPSLLGLDRLKEVIFQVDLKAKKLNFLKQLPPENICYPLRRLSPGHMTIPLQLGTVTADALFDTGADTTVIDSQFVKDNMQLFKLLRSDEGTDALGNKIPSEVFLCESVQVGDLIMKEVEMAAFDFGGHLRKHMEGASIILGNNVISQAKWAFDLTLNHWTCEVVPFDLIVS